MDAPYIVEIDGVPVRCQTAESALALIRAHGGTAPNQAGSGANTPNSSHVIANNQTRWTDQRVGDFFKLIEGKQRKLIDELMNYENGRTDEQLLGLLGLPGGSALGGVFSGLWKNAKKVGADPKELYIRKPVSIGDRRGFEYTLSAGFRQAAARRAKAAK